MKLEKLKDGALAPETRLNLSDLVKPRMPGLNYAIAYERNGWAGLKNFESDRIKQERDDGQILKAEILQQAKLIGQLETSTGQKLTPAYQNLMFKWQFARESAFETEGRLPHSLRESVVHGPTGLSFSEKPDPLLLLTDTPKIGMRSLLELADKAGMMIFPFDLLKESARPERSLVRAIENIQSATKSYKHYVLAPLTQLDLEKYSQIDDRPKMYISKDLKSEWHSIQNYLLPSYRIGVRNRMAIALNEVNLNHLNGRVERLEDRVGLLGKDLQDFKRKTQADLQTLEQSVEHAQLKIEEERRQRLIADRELRSDIHAVGATLRQEVARLDHRIDCLMDPMFLAIPHKEGRGLFEMGIDAYVGPVWGPELPQIVVAAMGLRDSKARATIQESVKRWAGTIHLSN